MLEDEIKKAKVTRYAIGKATGINEGILSKMINNKQGGCSAKTASKLLDYFGYKLIKKEE